jgi:hypothetical protein
MQIGDDPQMAAPGRELSAFGASSLSDRAYALKGLRLYRRLEGSRSIATRATEAPRHEAGQVA